jgi:hypothetical protein
MCCTVYSSSRVNVTVAQVRVYGWHNPNCECTDAVTVDVTNMYALLNWQLITVQLQVIQLVKVNFLQLISR